MAHSPHTRHVSCCAFSHRGAAVAFGEQQAGDVESKQSPDFFLRYRGFIETSSRLFFSSSIFPGELPSCCTGGQNAHLQDVFAHSVLCIVCCVQCVVCTLCCVYSVWNSVHSLLCAVHSVHIVLCVQCVQCTVHTVCGRKGGYSDYGCGRPEKPRSPGFVLLATHCPLVN